MAGGVAIASETGVGIGLLRPSAVRPALRWNLDRRLTTCGVACVRIPTGPPYGVMGNTWVVPLSVLTATQRLSSEKAMSCTCDRKKNKAGNVCIMWQWRMFMQPLLQWKGNKYYIFWVCICIQQAKLKCRVISLSVAC